MKKNFKAKKNFKEGGGINISADRGLVTITIRHSNGSESDIVLFDDDNNLQWFKENFQKAYVKAVAHKPKKSCPYLRLIK